VKTETLGLRPAAVVRMRGCWNRLEEGKTEGRGGDRSLFSEEREEQLLDKEKKTGGIWRIGCGLEKESSLWECLEMAPVSGEKSGWNG